MLNYSFSLIYSIISVLNVVVKLFGEAMLENVNLTENEEWKIKHHEHQVTVKPMSPETKASVL